MKCKICGAILTDKNWYKTDQEGVFQICKDCRKAKRNGKRQMFINNAF